MRPAALAHRVQWRRGMNSNPDFEISDADRFALGQLVPRDLGKYRFGFNSMKIAVAGADDKVKIAVFRNQVREACGYVRHGLDKQTAVDELCDIAQNHNALRDADIETIITDEFGAFAERETPPRINGDAGEHDQGNEPLPFIDVAAWDGEPVPERQWLVRDRIPARQPFLLTGAGGVGKSILALQLSVAGVLARDWLGTMPEPGPVIYLAAEDETAELHRRLAGIAGHYGAPFSALRDLRLMSFAGEDATLGAPDRSGVIKPTPLFERIRKAARDIQPKLIVLDTVSDIFAGNESDRTQVAAFVKLLQNMAMAADAAVIVNAHPSLSGIASGRGTSGSTGWHDKFRGRAYFKPVTVADGEADTDLRELQFMKNNFGPKAASIPLRWQGGVFIPVQGDQSLDAMATAQHAETVFLALLASFNSQNRNVSPNPGPTYAPTIFAREPDARGLNTQALKDAMSRLFDRDQVHVELSGPPSHKRSRLMIGGQP
jgi:RecA-family ATPase